MTLALPMKGTAGVAEVAAPAVWRVALKRTGNALVTFALTAAVLIALWYLFLRVTGVGSYVGKSPTDVWSYLMDAEQGGERRSELWSATSTTMWQAGLGYLVGTLVAVAVSIVFVLSRAVERAVMPIALALRSVPIVAMIPLLAYLFGRDVLGSMIVVAIIVWFPTLVFMTFGLRSLTKEQYDLLRALHASKWQYFLKARVPAALPSFFAAAKVTAPAAILGALINGWLTTGDGLGNLMLLSTTSSKYARLWAAVVVVTLLSMLLVAVVTAIESIVLARFAPDRLAER
jgi:ABC-type nitrate/sulfonate/bicarbonate transport system permease component